MFTFFQKTNTNLVESDFLVKSTFGVSIVSFLILLPFGINNFIQDRKIGGIITIGVAIIFAINAYIGWRGRYAIYLNLCGVVPAFTLGAVNAIITLQVVGSYWSYLCAYAIYFILPFQYAKYANAVFLTAVISAAWFSLEHDIFLRFSVVLIGTSIFIFISNKEITKTQKTLKKQATTDSLTGLLNRVKMPSNLEKAISKNKEEGVKSTLCIVDLDHFKKINDTFGHDAGDKVLVDLSTCILSKISDTDTLFRIGGEEFLILMKNTSKHEGIKIAEEVRIAVENLTILDDHQVTISIGVTEVQADSNWKEWMKLTDNMLYVAKRNGRNRVVS